MRVLTFASQKGGSGKTTLAGHVAVEAERSGYGRVALIDTDPQGSLAEWWNDRAGETPCFVHTYVARIADDLARLKDLGMRLVVIDTPPAVTATIEAVIAVSDLVVVPARPSPHDLRAAGTTIALAETAGKPLAFVVNAATPRARLTAEAAAALSQYGGLAPVTVHQRTDLAASMIDGRTVAELAPRGRSAAEIAALWSHLAERLEAVVPPAPQQPLRAAGGGVAVASVAAGRFGVSGQAW